MPVLSVHDCRVERRCEVTEKSSETGECEHVTFVSTEEEQRRGVVGGLEQVPLLPQLGRAVCVVHRLLEPMRFILEASGDT